jgi:hypothetical protein
MVGLKEPIRGHNLPVILLGVDVYKLRRNEAWSIWRLGKWGI